VAGTPISEIARTIEELKASRLIVSELVAVVATLGDRIDRIERHLDLSRTHPDRT